MMLFVVQIAETNIYRLEVAAPDCEEAAEVALERFANATANEEHAWFQESECNAMLVTDQDGKEYFQS